MKTVTGTLDDQPLTAGAVTELYRLDLGEHTPTVKAETQSGASFEQSLKFTTTTSTDEISALIVAFKTTGTLSATARREAGGRHLQGHGLEDKGREARQEEDACKKRTPLRRGRQRSQHHQTTSR